MDHKTIEGENNFSATEKKLVEHASKGNICATYEAQAQAAILLVKSIRSFDESSSRLAKALNWFTFVIAFVAVIQIGLQIYLLLTS